MPPWRANAVHDYHNDDFAAGGTDCANALRSLAAKIQVDVNELLEAFNL